MNAIISTEGCAAGCAKVVIENDQWDNIEIWGFVIAQTANRTGDPENRHNRTRTTRQHEQQHMDFYERQYKQREAVTYLLLTFRCEKREIASERLDLINAAWDAIDTQGEFNQYNLEVEDYSNDIDIGPYESAVRDAASDLGGAINDYNDSNNSENIESITFN